MEERPGEPLFNPETYRGNIVDIVHIQSIERVLNGKKPSEPEVRNKAVIVARNINALREAKIPIRQIDNPSKFDPPSENKPIVVGGAFVGECLADYLETARKKGFNLKADPWLSVGLD